MARWAPQLIQLDARGQFNMTFNTSAIRENPWMVRNGTKELIAGLKLAQVETLRTMHVTVGAFSLAVALLTVHRIISDARRAVAVQIPQSKT